MEILALSVSEACAAARVGKTALYQAIASGALASRLSCSRRSVTVVSSRSFKCSSCGTPIGIMDLASGLQIEALKKQVAAIDERLTRITQALQD